MAAIHIYAARTISAPAAVVYSIIADYRGGHREILPAPPFHDLVVEEGGLGAGTVVRFGMTVWGRSRVAHARVTEPDPGRSLVESILETPTVTTFTVTGFADGTCRVSIETDHETGGIRGLFERLTMPRFLEDLYRRELQQLENVAVRHARASGSPVAA